FVNQMLGSDAKKIIMPQSKQSTNLNTVHDALQNIVDLTAPFARGTHQKVNSIAHTALVHIKQMMERR
ncbi:MAG: hypothetical protein EB015_21020, partial [Methylocystaceae bacterium]|nr:hypothetical protein [Methylocystaceae bacterium]